MLLLFQLFQQFLVLDKFTELPLKIVDDLDFIDSSIVLLEVLLESDFELRSFGVESNNRNNVDSGIDVVDIFLVAEDKIVVEIPPSKIENKEDDHSDDITTTFSDINCPICVVQVSNSKSGQYNGKGAFVSAKSRPSEIGIEGVNHQSTKN